MDKEINNILNQRDKTRQTKDLIKITRKIKKKFTNVLDRIEKFPLLTEKQKNAAMEQWSEAPVVISEADITVRQQPKLCSIIKRSIKAHVVHLQRESNRICKISAFRKDTMKTQWDLQISKKIFRTIMLSTAEPK